MKPTRFAEQTVELQKPPGMTDEECGPLPIARTPVGQCISCWRMNWKERLKCLFTGRVWLWVWSGETQPPVYVGGDHPWRLPMKTRLRDLGRFSVRYLDDQGRLRTLPVKLPFRGLVYFALKRVGRVREGQIIPRWIRMIKPLLRLKTSYLNTRASK